DGSRVNPNAPESGTKWHFFGEIPAFVHHCTLASFRVGSGQRAGILDSRLESEGAFNAIMDACVPGAGRNIPIFSIQPRFYHGLSGHGLRQRSKIAWRLGKTVIHGKFRITRKIACGGRRTGSSGSRNAKLGRPQLVGVRRAVSSFPPFYLSSHGSVILGFITSAPLRRGGPCRWHNPYHPNRARQYFSKLAILSKLARWLPRKVLGWFRDEINSGQG
ncbi:MAG: hypothetical protein ACP5XB_13295, partial [Isosphaeraceae bacterium]